MDNEFGPRRPREGETEDESVPSAEVIPGQPPPQRVRLRLPTSQPRAVWVLLALNILMFVLANVLSFTLDPRSCPAGIQSMYDCSLSILGWKENDLIYQGQYW